MFEIVLDWQEKMVVEHHSSLPIMLVKMRESFDWGKDMPEADVAVINMLEEVGEEVYWVVDLLGLSLSLEEMIGAANQMTRGQSPVWMHPLVKQVILITKSGMIKMAAKGMASDIFGNLDVKSFETVEGAITYVSNLAG